jgi:hypothetical protein
VIHPRALPSTRPRLAALDSRLTPRRACSTFVLMRARPPQPVEILALAERFARASGRPIEMTTRTALLVAHALRTYADELMRPGTESIGLFAVEVRRPHESSPQIVCVTGSIPTAKSAYEIACAEYPDRAVTLRHSRRVLERRDIKGEAI